MWCGHDEGDEIRTKIFDDRQDPEHFYATVIHGNVDLNMMRTQCFRYAR